MFISKRDVPLHLTPSIKKAVKNLIKYTPGIKIHKLRQAGYLQVFFIDTQRKGHTHRMHSYGPRGAIHDSCFYSDDWDLVGYYCDGKVCFY